MRPTPKQVALVFGIGFFLIQVAWVLAVPPFRAMDEFDHAYRAAAVADQQWLPSDRPVVDGRGSYVHVPAALVEAAAPVCRWYDYTGPDNCRAVTERDSSGRVDVASAAALYNPAWYAVIGTPSSLFSDYGFLYALRILGAALCALVLGAATYAVRLASTSMWPLLAILGVATPTLMYSTASAAPNGLEMSAGLLVWCSVLALRARHSTRTEGVLVGLFTVGAVLLVLPRLMGPFWLALILVSMLPVVSVRRWREILGSSRVTAVASVGAVGAACAMGLAWSWIAQPNQLDEPIQQPPDNALLAALAESPVWIMQTIAGFPMRNDPAPMIVYAIVPAAVFVLLTVVGRHARRTEWLLFAGLVLVWFGVQLAISTATISTAGTIWQGRYALPYGVGPLIVFTVLATSRKSEPPHPVSFVPIALALTTAHAVSVIGVARGEANRSYLTDTFVWLPHPSLLLGALVVAACSAMVLVAYKSSHDTGEPATRPLVHDAA